MRMYQKPKNISHAKAQRRKRNTNLSLRLCAFAGIFLLVGVCLPILSGAQTQTGIAELNRGDYENAAKLLSARLASNPNDAVAQTALLRVYLETGRYAETEAGARKFLAKTPDAGPVRHQLGAALAR